MSLAATVKTLPCLLSFLLACHASTGADRPVAAEEPAASADRRSAEAEAEAELTPDERKVRETEREIARTVVALIADLPNDLAAFRGEELQARDDGTVTFQARGTELMHAHEDYVVKLPGGAYLYGATWRLDEIAAGVLTDALQHEVLRQANDDRLAIELHLSPPGQPPVIEIVVLRDKRGIASFTLKSIDEAAWLVVGSTLPGR